MIPITPTTPRFRQTLGRFLTGVAILTTTLDSEQYHAITINAFTSVSLEPPLVLVCVQNTARMQRYLEQSGQFGISILHQQQEEIARFFAHQAPYHQEMHPPLVVPMKWECNLPFIEGSLAHIGCNIVTMYPGGDHTIFIGEVIYFHAPSTLLSPLSFFCGQYHH